MRVRRIVVALVIGAGAVGLWQWLGSRADRGPTTWVTATTDRGPIVASVTATGTIDPVDSVQVGTYVSGPIQEVLVDFNAAVTAGQLLARIDPRPFELKVEAAAADVATARARVARARAELAFAEATLRRIRRLAARGIVASSELDLATTQARQAAAAVDLETAAVRVAEARLAEARVNLAYSEIRSPVTGVVVSRNVSVGQTVAASFQTPTLFLVAADLSRMQARVSVSEADIGAITEAQEAVFTVDAWPDQEFRGRVLQVRNAPVNVQNVVTYDVLVGVDNSSLRLRPGMTATVRIVTMRREDALRVPTAAVRFRPPEDRIVADARNSVRGPTLWTPARGGMARPLPVATGIADDHYVELTSNVAPGTIVIVGLARDPDAGAERPLVPAFGLGPSRPSRR